MPTKHDHRDKTSVQVGDRRLVISNLSKILYPATGFTKGEVLDYYARVAPVLLPHLAGRPLTRKRYPNGVDGPSFFEKNAPRGTPEWVRTVTLPVPGSTKNARNHRLRDRRRAGDAGLDGQPRRAGVARAAVAGRPSWRRPRR